MKKVLVSIFIAGAALANVILPLFQRGDFFIFYEW